MILQQKNSIISLRDVVKVYGVRQEKPTLVENFIHWNKREEFLALNDISLEIIPGEKIGIVGRNGSGKTTLLKIIAGISSPTSGEVFVDGRVVSLIDVTAGFHKDLSGHENLYLNGLLIGMTKKEIEEKRKKIVAFADIGDFIYAPLHTYSEGMKLRLGISVALQYSKPDILLLDEGIIAGDSNFQKKSMSAVNDLVRAKTTVLMVSHWLSFLERHCDRFILMKDGEIVKDGDVSVLRKYEKRA